MSETTKRGPIINHVYRLRKNRAYAQKHLARLLGHADARMVSQYERGVSLPPVKTALLLEIVLGARLPEIYPDLYDELQQLVLKRAESLPAELVRHIRGRILGED